MNYIEFELVLVHDSLMLILINKKNQLVIIALLITIFAAFFNNYQLDKTNLPSSQDSPALMSKCPSSKILKQNVSKTCEERKSSLYGILVDLPLLTSLMSHTTATIMTVLFYFSIYPHHIDKPPRFIS
jgi:hypothetical protein